MWSTRATQLEETGVPQLHLGVLVEIVPNGSILDSFRNTSLQYKGPVVGVKHRFQGVEKSLHLAII